MEFKRNKILLGENVAKIYVINKYPPSLGQGWASKITNLPNVLSCQMFEPCDNSALLESLSGSIRKYNAEADNTKDPLTRQRAERASEDASNLMRRIEENGEVIGFMSNMVMVSARDDEELEKSCRSFEGVMASLNCKARVLVHLQKEAFKTISPYNVPNDEVLDMARRNVPMSSFIEGFPFASNCFVDPSGYPFGRNSKNGLVALDPWVRGGDRTNSNFVVLGITGMGKSTVVKYLMTSEFMTGTVCLAIDPEKEYVDLVRNLEGDVINAGGGAFIINPLQFKNVPLDDEDEKDFEKIYPNEKAGGGNASVMALHFKTLEVFFKLYNSEITNKQMSLLKQLLEKLYNNFGIDWHTDVSTLKNEDYPTLSDLYDLVVRWHTDDATYKNDVAELGVMLRELAEGADSFLFNGHTSASPNSNFVCLEISDLQNNSENVKRAQYYNLLTWTWERMSRDRDEKVMLFADEAYLLVDPQVPQSLIYLRNISKRARKYGGALGVISHSVVDFLDPSIKMYGQALLDMPCYKIIMGTDGVNLQELSKIYNLSEHEQEICASKKRGQAIFFVGSRRFIVNFDGNISKYERDLQGTAGGK